MDKVVEQLKVKQKKMLTITEAALKAPAENLINHCFNFKQAFIFF